MIHDNIYSAKKVVKGERIYKIMTFQRQINKDNQLDAKIIILRMYKRNKSPVLVIPPEARVGILLSDNSDGNTRSSISSILTDPNL